MKSKLFNILLQFIRAIILVYFKVKCWVYFYLYGAEGISHVIERLPGIYMVPIFRRSGCNIGQNCRLLPGITFHNLSGKKPLINLTIRDNAYIGRNVLLDMASSIEIQEDAAIGAACQIWTHVGDMTFDFSDYHEKVAPVKIQKGVIVWSGVIISPGITIGEYSRVAAGSVVIRDIEAKSFYAGVPAKKIKDRNI